MCTFSRRLLDNSHWYLGKDVGKRLSLSRVSEYEEYYINVYSYWMQMYEEEISLYQEVRNAAKDSAVRIFDVWALVFRMI